MDVDGSAAIADRARLALDSDAAAVLFWEWVTERSGSLKHPEMPTW
jgi:hypothetical protein